MQKPTSSLSLNPQTVTGQWTYHWRKSPICCVFQLFHFCLSLWYNGTVWETSCGVTKGSQTQLHWVLLQVSSAPSCGQVLAPPSESGRNRWTGAVWKRSKLTKDFFKVPSEVGVKSLPPLLLWGRKFMLMQPKAPGGGGGNVTPELLLWDWPNLQLNSAVTQNKKWKFLLVGHGVAKCFWFVDMKSCCCVFELFHRLQVTLCWLPLVGGYWSLNETDETWSKPWMLCRGQSQTSYTFKWFQLVRRRVVTTRAGWKRRGREIWGRRDVDY